MNELRQISLEASSRPLSDAAANFIADGRELAKHINCFDFVPSNYENAWSKLDALPRGRFCEWGSGLGIVTGLAELLGFEAYGVEQDLDLCQKSQDLFQSRGLKSTISHESYFESKIRADIYYVYCWPSIMMATEAWFAKIAQPDSLLVIGYGQDDLRGFQIEPNADEA